MASDGPRRGGGPRFWTWFGRGMAVAMIGGAIVLLIAVVLYVMFAG
jgi:fumarate reductase subunit D